MSTLTFPEVAALLVKLLNKVMEDLDALAAKLPAGVYPSLEEVEAIVKNAVLDFVATDFVHSTATELMALLATMRSVAPHDPTELA